MFIKGTAQLALVGAFSALLLSASLSSAQQVAIEELVPNRIELLTVASSGNAIESWFGHSALLLIPEGRSWRDGFVINLNANTTGHSDKEFNYLVKGATGTFPFFVESFPASIYFYTKLVEEGRDVERTIIPLTNKQKKDLWNATLTLSKNPKEMGQYYYLQKNCSSMILFLLKKANIQINYEQIMSRTKFGAIAPKQVKTFLSDVLLTPYASVRMKSIRTQIIELGNKYKITLGSEFLKEKNVFAEWSQTHIQKFKSMSLEELLVAAQSLGYMDLTRSKVLQAEIRSRGQMIKTRFVEFQNLPLSLYQTCDTPGCLSSTVQELKNIFSTQDLRQLYVSMKKNYERIEQLHIPELDLRSSPQAAAWKNLTLELQKELGLKTNKRPFGL